ncbi:hypothetical protein ACHAXR_007734 [Thalassiosira sp. AJA248-18]
MKSSRQKSLKPLLETGTAVYSAYWDPTLDPDRTSDPTWYPGIISSYTISKRPLDDKYGRVRYYNIHFDDGDVIDGVPDHFVMGAEEYEFCLRLDNDDDSDDSDDSDDDGDSSSDGGYKIGDNPTGWGRRQRGRGGRGGGGKNNKKQQPQWLGVRNVTDRTSPDLWAKHVGWYVATYYDNDDSASPEEHTFSLLSDALRAYDASVIRCKLGAKAESIEACELNIPEDWSRLLIMSKKLRSTSTERLPLPSSSCQDTKKKKVGKKKKTIQSNNNNEEELMIKEAIKDTTTKLTKRHKAEIDRLTHHLQKKADESKSIAVREATSNERRHVRELQSTLKKELKAQHDAEMAALKMQHGEEVTLLKEEMETAASAAIKEQEGIIAKQQQKLKLKPRLEVGEEVVAAWWPDMNRKDTASWYPGRIKSYVEVQSDNDGEDDSGGGEYGPARLYTIKYDDDGTQLSGIPEHYVFPKSDYLLSTNDDQEPTNRKWKGVRNVTDASSNDSWAKLVGWYIATIDDGSRGKTTEEIPFSKLSHALRAYDASIAKRRGDKTKRCELNLPEEWEWLFAQGGIVKEEKTMYNDDELEEILEKEVEKEREKLKRNLEKKHEQDKERMVARAVKEVKEAADKERKQQIEASVEMAVKEAVDKAVHEAVETERKKHKKYRAMHNKLKKELKEQYEIEKSSAVAKAVADAKKKAKLGHDIARVEHERDVKEAVAESARQAKEETAKAVKEAVSRAAKEATRIAQIEHDVVHKLHMEKVQAELRQQRHEQDLERDEKEEALNRMCIELQQQQLEIDRWRKVEFETKQSSVDGLVVEGRQQQQQQQQAWWCTPAPALPVGEGVGGQKRLRESRVKLSHVHGGVGLGGDQAADVGKVTPPHVDKTANVSFVLGKENYYLPKGNNSSSQKMPTTTPSPTLDDRDDTCSSSIKQQQQQQQQQQFKQVNPKDQSAGEMTIEHASGSSCYLQGAHQRSAVDALLVAAEKMESKEERKTSTL